jgi:hypothetical protein
LIFIDWNLRRITNPIILQTMMLNLKNLSITNSIIILFNWHDIAEKLLNWH